MNGSWVIAMLLALVGAEPSGPEARVLEAMQATLPADVVVTELALIGRSDWSDRAQLVISWERGTRPGRRRARIVVRDGRESYRSWASARLVELRRVLVTTRPLTMGARIEAGDVKLESRPIPARRALDIAPAALVGQAALRDLAAGDVIGKKDVALPPPLPRGTRVQVVSRSGGVQVNMTGTLVQSVRLGGRGRVRVPMSRRALSGRLMEPERFVLEVSR